MLYHKESLVVIDVSQSVEHDHPNALQFLRSDITNVTKFFNARGSPVLKPQRLFEIIADSSIENDADVKRILDGECAENVDDDQYFFLNAYIPHKLDGVENIERDMQLEREGQELNNPYQKMLAKIVTSKSGDDEDESEL